MNGLFVSSVFAILIGAGCFYFKYRVIIGGTRCNARVETLSSWTSRFSVVSFSYKVKRLRKPIWPNFRRGKIGDKYCIYYNEKYPHSVTSVYWLDDVCFLIFIIGGIWGVLAGGTYG